MGLVSAEYTVNIDDISEFKSVPLFPKGLNDQDNMALAKAAKRNIVSFKPSNRLIGHVA